MHLKLRFLKTLKIVLTMDVKGVDQSVIKLGVADKKVWSPRVFFSFKLRHFMIRSLAEWRL